MVVVNGVYTYPCHDRSTYGWKNLTRVRVERHMSIIYGTQIKKGGKGIMADNSAKCKSSSIPVGVSTIDDILNVVIQAKKKTHQ